MILSIDSFQLRFAILERDLLAPKNGRAGLEPVLHGLRARWMHIQTEFVDEPRKSVEEADELVALTMKRLAETFARERDKLEREWGRGDDISTEDLRIALQRYRSFFDRLLSV